MTTWLKFLRRCRDENAIINIFEQSPANGADYRDPDVVGAWPRRRGTWLQTRMAEVARKDIEDDGE